MKKKVKLEIFHYNFFKKNRRGSHIGVVLSFIIFVIFLVFLYSTLEPLIKVDEDKKFMIEYLESALIEKLNTNLTTLTITNQTSITKNCIILEDLIGSEAIPDSKIIVKDYYRNIISSNIYGSTDLIVERSDSGKVFLKIYNSDEFVGLIEKSPVNCQLLSSTEYKIELLTSNEYISKTKAEKLINDYPGEYGNLKEEFGIPEGSDFGFGFIYNNESVIETESKNVSRSVYAENIPIRYLDNNANILSGFIKIKIW